VRVGLQSQSLHPLRRASCDKQPSYAAKARHRGPAAWGADQGAHYAGGRPLRNLAKHSRSAGPACCTLLSCCAVSYKGVRTPAQDQYKALGEHVHAVQAEVMAEQLATFKRSLEEFAIKHRWDAGTSKTGCQLCCAALRCCVSSGWASCRHLL